MRPIPVGQSSVNPKVVPPFPQFNLDVRRDGTAYLDGVEVPIPPGQEPMAVLIEMVARRAQNREGSIKAYRATTVNNDTGTKFVMVIDAEGHVQDINAPAGRTLSKGRKGAVVGVVGALVVVGAAAVTALAMFIAHSEAAPPPTATATASGTPDGTPRPAELPAYAPAGLSSHAIWASLPLANAARPQVVVSDSSLAVLVRDGAGTQLQFLDPLTGRQLHTSRIPATSSPLALTLIDGDPVVAIQAGKDLYYWPTAGDDAPSAIPLPDRAEVTYTPAGPLVDLPGASVALVRDGSIDARAMPAGATAISPGTGDALLAADGRGSWWSLKSSLVATDPSALPAPAGYEPAGPIGLLGDVLLYAWRPSTSDTLPWKVTGHRVDAAMEEVFVADLAGEVGGGSSRAAQPALWAASPRGDWGIYNRTYLNIATGTTHDLGSRWRTTSILADDAYSLTGTTLKRLTADGALTEESAPAGTVRFGVPVARAAGLALVPGRETDSTRLYALPTSSPASPLPQETPR